MKIKPQYPKVLGQNFPKPAIVHFGRFAFWQDFPEQRIPNIMDHIWYGFVLTDSSDQSIG